MFPPPSGQNIFVFPAHHGYGDFAAFVQRVGHHYPRSIRERQFGGRGRLDQLAHQPHHQPVFGSFGGRVYGGGAVDRREKRGTARPRCAYRHPRQPYRRGVFSRFRRADGAKPPAPDGCAAGQRSAPLDPVFADLFRRDALQSFVQLRLLFVPRAGRFEVSPLFSLCGGRFQRGAEHLFRRRVQDGRCGRCARHRHCAGHFFGARSHPSDAAEGALQSESAPPAAV